MCSLLKKECRKFWNFGRVAMSIVWESILRTQAVSNWSFLLLPLQIPHCKLVGFKKNKWSHLIAISSSMLRVWLCVCSNKQMCLIMSKRITWLNNQVSRLGISIKCSSATVHSFLFSAGASCANACLLSPSGSESLSGVTCHFQVMQSTCSFSLIPTHQLMSCLLSKSANIFSCLCLE